MTDKPIQDKIKDAELAVAGLEKLFGPGTIFTGDSVIQPIDHIPSGNIAVDCASGVGGFPRGRITEISGAEATGKSLLVSTAAREAQRLGEMVAYVDAEHALDPYWMSNVLKVKWDNLHIAQPNSGEQALIIAEKIIKSGAFGLVIIDSVAALTPRAEIEGEIGDQFIGLQARMMGQALRKMNPFIGDTNTAVVFVNQLRANISPMAMGGSVTPGGRALKFFSSLRIELSKIKTHTNQSTGEITGARIKAKFVKNKVAPPFKQVEYDVHHGKGYDNNLIALELGQKLGVTEKGGAHWFILDEEGKRPEKGIGPSAKASQYLDENPQVAEKLFERVRNEYRINQGYFNMDQAETVIEDNE